MTVFSFISDSCISDRTLKLAKFPVKPFVSFQFIAQMIYMVIMFLVGFCFPPHYIKIFIISCSKRCLNVCKLRRVIFEMWHKNVYFYFFDSEKKNIALACALTINVSFKKGFIGLEPNTFCSCWYLQKPTHRSCRAHYLTVIVVYDFWLGMLPFVYFTF